MKRVWLIALVLTSGLFAYTKVWIYSVRHPVSEPEGLYIVTFESLYDNGLRKYRIYCPTGMVRDITGGKWRKARKAYMEDRVKYGSKMIVRKVFEDVCMGE